MTKRNGKSASDGTEEKLRILAKEKEDVRRKLAVTAEKLQRKAKQLSVTAKQKEHVRRKLLVTAEKLQLKAWQLAVTAREKEEVRRKLVVTAKKLKLKAKQLAVTAREKEDVRNKLVVTAKEKEDVRRKLVVTAEKLQLKAKQLSEAAKEKEDVRRKLVVTAKELRIKARQLAMTAREKEDVRRKLVVTAKELRIKARQLAVTAREKENVRNKLVVTAKEKEDVRRKLVVTAKEKEHVRRKLSVTAKEKEDVRRKLVVTADELKLSRATLQKKVLERTKDLEQVKAKNEAILASIGDGLVATDTDERIVLVNKAFERSLGWKRDEVIGKLLSEVIGVTDADGNALTASEQLLMKSPKERTDTAATMYYKRKDGTSFPVSITVAPITAGNTLIGAVEVFRDSTKLKEIDRAKSEFMSIASHQLRTPLTAIRWALSSLKREKLTDEQRRLVSTAHETSTNMAVTISRMLMISHLEEDDAEPEIAEVDLCTVVGKVARLHDAHRERNGLKLIVECPEPLPVRTDEQLLIEILDNLISNAYKYTPRGGSVSLRVAKEEKQIRISVEDTGCGIPIAEQERIPEKFFRASNVASPAEAGTGIGLYMVYNIARVIGGSISFVSEENTGSTFTLLFPS